MTCRPRRAAHSCSEGPWCHSEPSTCCRQPREPPDAETAIEAAIGENGGAKVWSFESQDDLRERKEFRIFQ